MGDGASWGVLMSIYVPWIERTTVHVANTALGVALVDAVNAIAPGATPRLKWPNDLLATNELFKGRKLAGMLSEAVVDGGELRGVICGLGVNVSWPTATDIADAQGLEGAACINESAAVHVDRHELAKEILDRFDRELTLFATHGVAATHDRYRERCSTIGEQVRVEGPNGVLNGRATDLDPSGALLVSVDGQLHKVDVGDVIHLRPLL